MQYRFSATARQRLLLVAACTGLALFLLLHTATAQESGPDIQVPDSADAVVKVRGMACSSCAQRMKSALNDIEGVDQALVLLDKQEVVLTLSDKTIPSEKTLRETVTNAGYKFRTVVFAKGRTNNGADE